MQKFLTVKYFNGTLIECRCRNHVLACQQGRRVVRQKPFALSLAKELGAAIDDLESGVVLHRRNGMRDERRADAVVGVERQNIGAAGLLQSVVAGCADAGIGLAEEVKGER